MGQVFWWMNYHSNACCDVSHCSQLSSCQMMEHQTCKSKGFCLSICFPTLGSSFKDSSHEYFSGEAEQVPCWNVNHNSGFQTSGASLWAILETGCRGWGVRPPGPQHSAKQCWWCQLKLHLVKAEQSTAAGPFSTQEAGKKDTENIQNENTRLSPTAELQH